jgi:APA family basic amino acid/polyamine antiporter
MVTLDRGMGLLQATATNIIGMVGVGPFLTIPFMVTAMNGPHIIYAWAFGAMLALCDGLVYAELGAALPGSGGPYVYLREAFHPIAGFLVGWLTFFVIQAGTVATLATGFSAGLAQLVPLSESEQVALAVVLVLGTSLLNYYGVRHGARANNVTSFLKIGALALFVVAGVATGRGDVARLAASDVGSSAIGFSAFGLALSPVLFSYLGWNASLYVASEIRRPERNLPLAMALSVTFSPTGAVCSTGGDVMTGRRMIVRMAGSLVTKPVALTTCTA